MRDGAWRTMLGLGGALSLGVAAAWWATAGFRAITYDGARAAAIAEAPVQVPDVPLQTANGEVLRPFAAGDATRDGAVTIVDFISTRCPTVCVAQGEVFRQLQDSIAARGLTGRVQLLSVSFDPDDDSGYLRGFEETRRLQAQRWRIARVDGAERETLLQRFGIVVVRDPQGGWRHNAALHVVDARGALVRILAVEEGVEALRVATVLSAERLVRR